MSNRFDDENNIEMDIKTAFASWGKSVFKCFPQEGRLRSFLSEDSLDDSEEKNVHCSIVYYVCMCRQQNGRYAAEEYSG